MTVQSNRLPLLLASVGVILFVGALIRQMHGVPQTWKDSVSSVVGGMGGRKKNHITIPTQLPSFYEIALSHGTDKVTKHKYHHM